MECVPGWLSTFDIFLDSKVHGPTWEYMDALLGQFVICGTPIYLVISKTISVVNLDIWGRHDPSGPRAGPMNFAIWVAFYLTHQGQNTIAAILQTTFLNSIGPLQQNWGGTQGWTCPFVFVCPSRFWGFRIIPDKTLKRLILNTVYRKYKQELTLLSSYLVCKLAMGLRPD